MIAMKKLFVKMKHGKYSWDYVQIFKKANHRSPFNPCFKDDLILHYYRLIKRFEGTPVFSTKEQIKYSSIPFFLSFQELVKQKKELDKEGVIDSFSVIKEGGIEMKVIGYTVELYGLTVKELFYFVDNTFFMGEFIVKEISKNNPHKLLESIRKKYLNGLKEYPEKFYIDSATGETILIENDGFSLSLKYFSSQNAAVLDKLNKVVIAAGYVTLGIDSDLSDENDFEKI